MARLNFVKQGHGPTVVLAHALGCDLSMWDDVAAQLAPGFTVLRYDHRGHGRSEIVPGPFTIEDMADDAATLIAREVQGETHFVGISMGGMVAQALAARHPQLLTSLVIANSSSYYDEAARVLWRDRIERVKSGGMAAIADMAIGRWFTPEFRQTEEGAQRYDERRQVLLATDPDAYIAACEALWRIDFRETNPRIVCPTLVIGGTRDESTPLPMAQAICKMISGAELATLETAHLSAVEKPAKFAELVAGFIRGI
jgi:3-oxoadipate enol-lactonase